MSTLRLKYLFFMFAFLKQYSTLRAQNYLPAAGLNTSYLSDNPLKSGLDSLVERTVKKYMKTPQHCGLSIAVSKEGKLYYYNYGETHKGSKTLPTPTTIYEIGSSTATFAGLLLANAVFENKLKPDDDIRMYLPGNYPNLIYNKKGIQIRHLASYSSGLPNIPSNLKEQNGYDSLNPYKNYDSEQFLNFLSYAKVQKEPGTYSDFAATDLALIGMILENVYHKSLEELIEEKINRKYRLENTTIVLNEAQKKLAAQGYNVEGNPTPAWEFKCFKAAGALHSSTGDLMLYLNEQLKQSNEAVKLTQQLNYFGRQSMAWCWFVNSKRFSHPLYWHNGATFGFANFCGFIKEKNCAVVVLANTLSNTDVLGLSLLNYLQK